MPYTEEKGEITACGLPQQYNASKEFADKKVILIAVPGRVPLLFVSSPLFPRTWPRLLLSSINGGCLLGAFTPTCSVSHLPAFIENLSKIKSKGVDQIIVIAFNDAWVMSAWGKANGVKGDDIVSRPVQPTYLVILEVTRQSSS